MMAYCIALWCSRLGDHAAHTQTRREARIDRMRTQRQPSAGRPAYRTSGTPYMARPAIWREVQS